VAEAVAAHTGDRTTCRGKQRIKTKTQTQTQTKLYYMLDNNIIRVVLFTSYSGIFAVFAVLLLLLWRHKIKGGKHIYYRFLPILASICLIDTVLCRFLIVNALHPHIYVHLHVLFLLLMLLIVVLFYHFIWLITNTDIEHVSFSWKYYTITLGICGVVWVISLFIPFETRLQLVSNRFSNIDYNYLLSSILYNAMPVGFSIYLIIFAVKEFALIRKYRAYVADYTADLEHTALGWLYFVVVITLCMIVLPFTTLLYNWIPLLSSNIGAIMGVFLPIMMLVLVVNIYAGNYVIIRDKQLNGNNNDSGTATSMLSVELFTAYLQKNKSWRNPNICITDIAPDFCTNRNTMSQFINGSFGIDFRTLINSCRLCDLLLLEKNYPDKKFIEIVELAGFGTYRSYQRAKARQYNLNRVASIIGISEYKIQ
jgi:hypothetical protein